MKNPQQAYFQEYISIKPRYSVVYARCINPEVLTPRVKIKPLQPPPDNRSYNRLNNAMNYLIITSPKQWVYNKVTQKSHYFKLNFITLTLSDTQMHDDYFIKEFLLEPFLRWILQMGAKGYVWKAEAQDNGNIHFHITTNKFIHYQDIRDKWNTLQFRHGYLNSYQSKHGDTDANSTDVKAVKNEAKAITYTVKYILKPDTHKKSCSLYCEPSNHYYYKDNYKITIDEKSGIWEKKRAVEGHNFGYSRNLAKVKINLETTAKETEPIIQYLASIETKGEYKDFCTLYKHQLIDLKKCPSLLRELILAATSPDKREISSASSITSRKGSRTATQSRPTA